jgi:heme exporter protein D
LQNRQFFEFFATGGYSDTIYMQLAASRMQTLHALAASCVQSRQFFQFFASTLREQLFKLKNEDTLKKSENLRDTCACAYPLTLCMA